MTRISQKRFLEMELDKCQGKIKRDAVMIETLKNNIKGYEDLTKIYNGCIAALSAQVAGGQIPVDGAITIPRAEIQEAMKKQAVATHYDKESDSFIIQLKIVEGGKDDDISNGEGEGIPESNNDSSSGEGGEIKELCTQDERGSSEASEG